MMPARVPVHLEAALEPALARPRDVAGGGAAVREPDDHHRVVLARGPVAMDEGVAPGEDVPRRQVLAEQEARDLDPMARHVEQRPAPGELGVPEVGGVRAAVALPGAEGGHPPDRAGRDHVADAQDVRVPDDVLQVRREDAGVRHRAEHVGGLRRVPPERLRAGDGLPGRGGGEDGIAVEVVRERDDDEVHARVGADLLDRRIAPAVEALGERGASGRVRVAVRDDARVRDVPEPERVELPDEAGAEHAHADGSHQ